MDDFYQFYLSEHRNITNRRLHFLGTFLALVSIVLFFFYLNYWFLLGGVLIGYGPAWIGHFFFEKNKPASFKHPIKSFVCDWRMFFDIIRGKVSIKGEC